jgi:hypothetical protein
MLQGALFVFKSMLLATADERGSGLKVVVPLLTSTSFLFD